jgi:hypothetical protein
MSDGWLLAMAWAMTFVAGTVISDFSADRQKQSAGTLRTSVRFLKSSPAQRKSASAAQASAARSCSMLSMADARLAGPSSDRRNEPAWGPSR